MMSAKRKGPLGGFLIGTLVAALFAACSDGAAPATATTPPEPVTESYQEPCNNIDIVPELAGNTVVYAEHKFPGLTAAQIATRVHVMTDPLYPIADYVAAIRPDAIQEIMLIWDGAAAVVRGLQNQSQLLTTVTFVVR